MREALVPFRLRMWAWAGSILCNGLIVLSLDMNMSTLCERF